MTLFLLVFLAVGLLFTAFVLRSLYEAAIVYTWEQAGCEILSSRGKVNTEAAEDDPPYVFEVRYRYSWRGVDYASETRSLQSRGFSDWQKVQRLLNKYPEGRSCRCYVNPGEPSQAVLERGGLWLALMLPIPLIFVLIGGGGIYFTWFRRQRKESKVEPISEKAGGAGRRWVTVVLFTILLLAGGGIFGGFFLRPALQLLQSPSWQQTSCTVEFSRVGRHEGDESTTYSADILYYYYVDGVEYRSSRFRFQDFSGKYSDKRAIVKRYPKGKRTVCYYNPKDPWEAVLDRSFPKSMLFGLIPLVVFLVGALGLPQAVRKAGRSRQTARESFVVHPPEMGPVVLKPKISGLGKFLGCTFFALFWNGIVSVFLRQVISEWRRGGEPWFLTLFLTPFVAVGVGSVLGMGYFFLGLFSPRPRVTLTPGSVSLGGSASVEWVISGAVSAIRRLRIYVEGREEATYTRGTTTVTDRESFAHIELADLRAPFHLSRGTAAFTIPRDTMHSFQSSHNRIVWALHVRGEIRWWPDIEEEFEIQVRPAGSWELFTSPAGDSARF